MVLFTSSRQNTFVGGTCALSSALLVVTSFYRATHMHKRGLCRRAVPVCLSRSWTLSKRINMCSKFFHCQIATPLWFFRTKRHGNMPTEASNAGWVGTNRFGYRSMTAAVRTTTATVDGVVYRTDRHASLNIVYHNQYRRPRQREEKRIVRIGKSVADLTSNRRLRSKFCTIEVNY